jgi:hypothetical protein
VLARNVICLSEDIYPIEIAGDLTNGAAKALHKTPTKNQLLTQRNNKARTPSVHLLRNINNSRVLRGLFRYPASDVYDQHSKVVRPQTEGITPFDRKWSRDEKMIHME